MHVFPPFPTRLLYFLDPFSFLSSLPFCLPPSSIRRNQPPRAALPRCTSWAREGRKDEAAGRPHAWPSHSCLRRLCGRREGGREGGRGVCKASSPRLAHHFECSPPSLPPSFFPSIISFLPQSLPLSPLAPVPIRQQFAVIKLSPVLNQKGII